MIQKKKLFVSFMIVAWSWCMLTGYAESKLPQQEVDALREITATMGAKYWDFDSDNCTIRRFGMTMDPPNGGQSSVQCRCDFADDTFCHVVRIEFKGYSLPGTLSPALAQLPYLDFIDFAYNYLTGTIPQEWASTKLTSISLLVNHLSGEIPLTLANMTSLTYLSLEANQFSGRIPPELGNLVSLQTLMLSSNQLTGELPFTFARLTNLTDFRINDNNLNGTIPEFIQNWKKLERLELHASGLTGPIPSQISVLSNMVQLKISDINGPPQQFPNLSNMTDLDILVLRSCNIYGEIPPYMWTMQNLGMFDVSFNQLIGEIPSTINQKRINFVFLSGNLLSGQVPEAILKEGTTVDLSYNNLTWQSSQQPACQENMNLNINLFRSSSAQNNESRLPCLDTFRCPRYYSCLHVNCGGEDITVRENRKKIIYKGDGDVLGGAAKLYLSPDSYWGFSSTGDFMDDNDFQNTRFSVSSNSSNLSELYTTARTAPISLTYFHYCLENGMYTLNLGFAEILFTNDKTFNSLGKRLFDIYVQDKLIWKDYNIEAKAGGALKPAVEVHNVSVSNHILEIRLYFAGKGTTRIPRRGVYGPLISAISITSNSNGCPSDEKDKTVYIVVGAVLGTLCLLLLMLFVLWWRCCTPGKLRKGQDLSIQDLPSGTFPLKQIRAATNDFDEENKVGEGGFGCVYKGQLADGTVIAVKQLSSKSRQGNREFLNEIGMISCLQHPNLVKLHGCCIERDQLLLVYEYMENNSLARALFGPEKHRLKLDWQTRCKICIGIAKGLAFLHEESRLKIVHRDIKTTNVLLDRDLNPKISDFGLARLGEEEKTHISTRVAGTIGYMAPEYALWGYLTYKADVYSFGVVVLEIISGKSNNNYMPKDDFVCLLDWACHLQHTGNLMEFIDVALPLQDEVKVEAAETIIKVALLCTNASPSLRPTMSEVVNMLEGKMAVPDVIPGPSKFHEDLRFKAIRDFKLQERHGTLAGSHSHISTTSHTFGTSSVSSSQGHFEITPESRT